jgi:hypothetical protein
MTASYQRRFAPARSTSGSYFSLVPKFFRAGSDAANIAELGDSEALFWQRHRFVMDDLGYGTNDA